MARIRDLLVSASLIDHGEMVSYIPVTAPCDQGMYCNVDINSIRIHSNTKAGAIVLLCDYIFKNAVPRWSGYQVVDLYKYIDNDIIDWETEQAFVSDSDKLAYAISYMFVDGSEVMLIQEKPRTILLD